MYHYTACGLDNIYLKNGYKLTNSPSGEGVSIHDLEGLHDAISIGLVKKEFPLTPSEFKYLRIELDLSQKALGKLMDKTDQIIAKWEKGTQPIPVLADKAIRDLYTDSINAGHVSGLLNKLAEIDRKMHELILELEETETGWNVELSEAA